MPAERSMEQVMSKIEKLLRLSESPNEAEAAAAAAKARELLVEYNLELEDVRGRTNSEVAAVSDETVQAINSNVQNWEVELAGTISRNFFSKVLIGKGRFYFVGEKHDVEVTIFTFNQLRTRLQDMAYKATQERNEAFKKAYGVSPRHLTGANHPKTWRTSWLHGAVRGIAKKLYEAKQADSNRVTAIVVRKDERIAAYVSDTFGRTTTRQSSTSIGAHDAYARGYETGRSMDIHSGLNGSGNESRRLGG